MIFHSFLAITLVWDLIETWGFRVDDPCDFPDIPMSPHKKITKQTSRNLLKMVISCSFLAITPVWDLIKIFWISLKQSLQNMSIFSKMEKNHHIWLILQEFHVLLMKIM